VGEKSASLVLLLMTLVLFGASASAQSESVQLKRMGDQISVLIGGKPFTTYYFDPKTAKAYVQPLRSARGVIVTRGFPIGDTVPLAEQKDPSLEPHQRPLYFAHGDINGLDFWGEEVFRKFYGSQDNQRYGRMVFRKLQEMRAGPGSGTIRAEFDLVGTDGRPFAEETQQYTFRGNEDSRLVDCEFVIRANRGALKIGDTKEGTFAIRVAPELNAPKGHMVNSEGGEGEPQIWGKRANWVDYDGVVDGEKLGIAIFDSPRSFRHPTYWHARGYGLLAANPFGWREFYNDPEKDGSWTIQQGKELKFRYRVFIHHGDYRQAKVAEVYQEYATHER
jgi:hypothetical protein